MEEKLRGEWSEGKEMRVLDECRESNDERKAEGCDRGGRESRV